MVKSRTIDVPDPSIEPLAWYVEGIRPEEAANPLYLAMHSLMGVLNQENIERSPRSAAFQPIAVSSNWHYMREAVPDGLPWSVSVAALPLNRATEISTDNRHIARRNEINGRVEIASFDARGATWGDVKIGEGKWDFQRTHRDPSATEWFFETNFRSQTGKGTLHALLRRHFVVIDHAEEQRMIEIGQQENHGFMTALAKSSSIRVLPAGAEALLEMVERLTESVPAIDAYRAAVRTGPGN